VNVYGAFPPLTWITNVLPLAIVADAGETRRLEEKTLGQLPVCGIIAATPAKRFTALAVE
jgi:hypothetical protein